MVLTVKNTLPCLKYAASEVAVGAASLPHQNGESISSLARQDASPTTGEASPTTGDASPTQGAASTDEEITVIIPKKGDSGFFKVSRE